MFIWERSLRAARILLRSAPLTLRASLPRAQTVHVVEDDFDGGREWNGQNQSHGSPEPAPEQQSQGHRQGIQLQAAADDLGIEQVQGDHVADGDHGHNGEEALGGQRAHADHHGRQNREHDAEIGQQADDSADHPDDVEVGHAENPECDGAGDAEDHSDDDVAHDEAANHLRNQSQGDVGGVAVLHAEQHHGRGPHVVLPAQHEEDQEWDEGRHQHDFGDSRARRWSDRPANWWTGEP